MVDENELHPAAARRRIVIIVRCDGPSSPPVFVHTEPLLIAPRSGMVDSTRTIGQGTKNETALAAIFRQATLLHRVNLFRTRHKVCHAHKQCDSSSCRICLTLHHIICFSRRFHLLRRVDRLSELTCARAELVCG